MQLLIERCAFSLPAVRECGIAMTIIISGRGELYMPNAYFFKPKADQQYINPI
jgi:hypothetical protein